MPVVGVSSDLTDRSALLDDLASRLVAGEIVVLPTDTVYGLVGLAGLPGTLDRLRVLKGRPDEMPIAVLTADAAQAFELADQPPRGAQRAAARWWPGALTLVLRAGPSAPGVSDDDTIGVRCPDDALLQALARRVGPLAATSANHHGSPTGTTAEEASATFPDLLVVDGGALTGAPSTVIDCTRTPPVVLRAGHLDPALVAVVLAET